MPAGSAVTALAGGSLIFLGFIVFFLFAIAFSYYTIKGSGIDEHPSDGLDGGPGSEAPSEVGPGRTPGEGDETHSEGGPFSAHGTG